MVPLYQGSPSMYPPSYVRRVFFHTLSDIPELFAVERSSPASSLPTNDTAAPIGPLAAENEHREPAETDSGAMSDNFDQQDVDTVSFVPETTAAQIAWSETEVVAARRISRTYRVYRSRRGVKKAMTILRDQAFGACLQASSRIPARSYRLRYLGPLPHLLACLQSLHVWAHQAKSLAKQHLRKVSHLKLEEMMEKITATKWAAVSSFVSSYHLILTSVASSKTLTAS